MSVNPTSGSPAGGTSVTITGTNFIGATGVSFGGSACAISNVTSTQIDCITSAHAAGTVSVEVTTPSGTSAPNTLYTYVEPTPAINVSPNGLTFGNQDVGTASVSQSYDVSGTDLGTTPIVVSASNTDFEVSLSSGTGFGSSVSIAPVDGTVVATPVYVRFRPQDFGARSGSITNISGTASQSVAVSGTGSYPSALTVTNTSDAGGACLPGSCSLRQAITAANASGDMSTINFNIPGPGVHTITPATALPPLTSQVTINGYSQPESSANTLAVGDDAVILIELDGTGAPVGTSGINILTSDSTVRGLIINRFGAGIGNGITISSGSGNVIEGCWIGTDATGELDFGNSTSGIEINSADNTVGGTGTEDRNIISGNDGDGVKIQGAAAQNNLVINNYIGTNAGGSSAIGNASAGVRVSGGARSNTIGGTEAAEQNNTIEGTGAASRNILSGNAAGVVLTGFDITDNSIKTSSNLVVGNYIGTNAVGGASVGNLEAGVMIDNEAQSNTIGAGNVISGNSGSLNTPAGVIISGASTTLNSVKGNYIGLGADGSTALGNGTCGAAGCPGVLIKSQAGDNTIGGTTAADRNVVSGNLGDGVRITDNTTAGNKVLGNFIGTAADGTTARGNLKSGVYIFGNSGTSNNQIGGVAAGEGNVIANNGTNGVTVRWDSVGSSLHIDNPIRGNFIYDNTGLGIDLDDDGVTVNDILPGDPDSGGNGKQNYPVITSAAIVGGTPQVSGTLSSGYDQTFDIDLYTSPTCNSAPNTFGEGATYIGSTTATTTTLNDTASFTFAPASLPLGHYLTATATNRNADRATSEFSQCVQITSAGIPQTITVTQSAPETAVYNSTFSVKATGGASGNPVVVTTTASTTPAGTCSIQSSSVNGGETTAVIRMDSGIGECYVHYNQAGNGVYDPAPQVTQTVQALKADQAITPSAPASAVYGSTFTASATGGGSGNPVVIANSGTGECSGGGNNTITITMTAGTGNCVLTYDQAGNDNYNAAPTQSTTTAAQPKTLTITADPKTKVFGTADPPLTYQLTSGTFVTGDGFTGSLTRDAGENVGSYNITQGTVTAGPNYAITYQGAQLTITKADQTITVTMAAPMSAVVGSTFNVAATGGGSGNPVTIVGSGACSGTGNNSATITMTSGTGTCVVTYNQLGDANHNDAPQVLSNTTAINQATVQFGFLLYVEDESQAASIIVERTGDLTGTTTVNFDTSVAGSPPGTPGACNMGGDYVPVVSELVTFMAGETQQTVSVTVCGDMNSEPLESVGLGLSGISGGVLGARSTAFLALNDTANQFTNNLPISVGTGNTSMPYPSTITVAGAPTVNGGMRLTLYDVALDTPENLDILLVGPGGQKMVIMGDAGGAIGNPSPVTLTFEDTAGLVLPDNGGLGTGKYEPTTWEAVSAFAAPAPGLPYAAPGSTIGGTPSFASVFGSGNPNGTWSLYIRDDAGAPFVPLATNIAGGWGLQFNVPTAAELSISGRVLTSEGRPIRGATITVTGGSLEAPIIVPIGRGGNYIVSGLRAGETYVVTANSRRFTFPVPNRVITLVDNVTDLDFVAEGN